MLNPISILLLVGEGSLFEEIKQKVEDLGLKDSVIFAGLRSDVEKVYSAMDIFFLPSLFEGLPFVLIEAQCTGVNCLVSDTVTKEAYITDLVMSLSLEENVETWADALNELSIKKRNRFLYAELIREKHYDIEYTASRLTEIYTS